MEALRKYIASSKQQASRRYVEEIDLKDALVELQDYFKLMISDIDAARNNLDFICRSSKLRVMNQLDHNISTYTSTDHVEHLDASNNNKNQDGAI